MRLCMNSLVRSNEWNPLSLYLFANFNNQRTWLRARWPLMHWNWLVSLLQADNADSIVESDKLHQSEDCECQNNAIDDERQHSNLFDESQKVMDAQISYYCRYRRSIPK